MAMPHLGRGKLPKKKNTHSNTTHTKSIFPVLYFRGWIDYCGCGKMLLISLHAIFSFFTLFPHSFSIHTQSLCMLDGAKSETFFFLLFVWARVYATCPFLGATDGMHDVSVFPSHQTQWAHSKIEFFILSDCHGFFPLFIQRLEYKNS